MVERENNFSRFKHGFISGIGSAFGLTVGFALVSVLLVVIVHTLGGVPLIGQGIAALVEATQSYLYR